MRKVKKNIALFLVSFMFLNVFYYKVSALEQLPKITSTVVEKVELTHGEEQAVKVKTDYTGNVQYLVYLYDYNTKKWTDLTGGYLPAVSGTSEQRISLGKNFSVGNYRITVRAKRAGQVGKYNNVSYFEPYDSYAYGDFKVENFTKYDVSIGLTQLGNINTLNFSLTGNYNVKGNNENISLAANTYTIKSNAQGFLIYKNATLIKSLGTNEIVIKPSSNDTYIKFVKESYTRNFPGEIILQKKSDNTMLVINKLDIEEYTKGVLPFEMGESFSLEALKAQAVVARTYAVANKGRYSSYGYDLTDDTRCQVYRGYNSSLTKCNRAVDETRSKVLKYLGQPISTVYCSSNGGYTERSENVWLGSQSYLIDQKDPFDSIRPSYLTNWREEKSNGDIFELLKKASCNIKEFVKIDISNIEKYPSGRIKKLCLIYKDSSNTQQKLELTKERARTFFGLKSAMYDVKYENSKYVFIGNGWGHGVGMSQWGAEGMARQNNNHNEILKFYYKNATLSNIY
ncbi:SpoIID/LytB domain-containing protein [Haloimpatiens massiliensis]|uniref:SpoIID/LytB domain-containing protein n=1 Tax=Haloimpatiens massiliensis TaxID=1658110 RepID=UPI000C81E699|nr:SpoIID/LytB domain-containing protein [Haloimpatiens massiliensis]